MVSIEQLEALDMLLWLRSGSAAASYCLCDESSITRRVRAALKAFDLRLHRGGEPSLDGDLQLLEPQRYVHQLARFSGFSRRPLRLEAPPDIRLQLLRPELKAWVLGPSVHRSTGHLLELLRQRVIDAWICRDRFAAAPDACVTAIRLPAWPSDLDAAPEKPLLLLVRQEWARQPAIIRLAAELRTRQMLEL